MACSILVSNKSGIPKAEIVDIYSSDHVFTRKETMAEHLRSGGKFEDWNRVFTLVIVEDKNKEDLSYLLNGWKFVEPPRNSEEWKEMYLTGQISSVFAEIKKHLIRT